MDRSAVQGLSSARTNVLWGIANLTASYVLLSQVGDFELRRGLHVAALGLGFACMSLLLARSLGRRRHDVG